MSLALLFLCIMLNMFRMLIHPSSGACDLFVELVHGLYCSGSMCVGVTLWFGCGGVVSVCRLKHYCNVGHDGLYAVRDLQAPGGIFFLCLAGKYKTTGLSETSVNFYHTVLRHAPEGSTFR